jgi:hypothetical protein
MFFVCCILALGFLQRFESGGWTLELLRQEDPTSLETDFPKPLRIQERR